MTPSEIFLFGMPFVLMAGAGVTLWFAKRAAKQIDGRDKIPPARLIQGGYQAPLGGQRPKPPTIGSGVMMPRKLH